MKTFYCFNIQNIRDCKVQKRANGEGKAIWEASAASFAILPLFHLWKHKLARTFWLKSGVTVKFYWDSEREDAKPKAQKSVSRGGKRRAHLPCPTQSGATRLSPRLARRLSLVLSIHSYYSWKTFLGTLFLFLMRNQIGAHTCSAHQGKFGRSLGAL